MKQALITGGAGFIGSHLVDKLLTENRWQVTVVDDFNDFYSPAIKWANLAKHLSNPNFSLVQACICDHQRLKTLFGERKFDVIVHLAARAGVRPSLAHPQLYARTNIDGTINLLELARAYGVRQFVFGSSSSVYGTSCELPFKESGQIQHPISPYAATKAACELFCHTYAHLYGIRAICLRFFTVYGARQRPDLAIHKFARLIDEEKPIPVYGNGCTRRDYTYIDDIIAGVRAAMEYEKSDFEIFNLGESRTVELNYLIELLEKHIGKTAKIKYLEMQPGDLPNTLADISKAQQFLGYNPTTQFEQGIEQFAGWFHSAKNCFNSIEKSVI